MSQSLDTAMAYAFVQAIHLLSTLGDLDADGIDRQPLCRSYRS